MGEHLLYSYSGFGDIVLFLYGNNDSILLVKSETQEAAYELALSFRSLLSVFNNHSRENGFAWFLLELSSAPNEASTAKDLARLISTHAEAGEMHWFLSNELQSGSHVYADQLSRARVGLETIIDDNHLKDALLLLENSFDMVDGNMNASYYHSHYKPDCEERNEDQVHKIHLENRFKYDSAFVSAFRGIECVLRSNNFGKKDTPGLLKEADVCYSTRFSKEPYFCPFDGETSVSLEEIINRFLKKRNAISAHGNPKAGRKPEHWVSEPQVYEIQHLLKGMLTDIIYNKNEL